MSDFPNIPRFIDDTDSIRNSSPRKSLRSSPYKHKSIDQNIKEALKQNGNIDINAEYLNRSYLEYIINSNYDEDEEEEEEEEEDDDYIASEVDDESEITYLDEEEFSEDDEPDIISPKRTVEKIETPEYDEDYETLRQRRRKSDFDLREVGNVKEEKSKFARPVYLGFISFVLTILIAILYYLSQYPISIKIPDIITRDYDSQISQLNQQLANNQQMIQNLQHEMNKFNQKLSTESAISNKNGQIQISPDFHQFLSKFIHNYQNSEIDKKLNQLKTELTKEKQLKPIPEPILQPPKEESSEYYENSRLKFISERSNFINYAPYQQGARILGFLTTKHNNTPLLNKLLYGWWYETNDEYNANHIILNDEIEWKEGEEVGIRLNKPIIPTDILLTCSDNVEVKIGFKPSKKIGFDSIPYDSFEGRIACKFKIISSVGLKGGINHIKLPIEFINFGIDGQDVYFRFDRVVNVGDLKVYGIDLKSV
ncbi:unnamed protein product [Candida verbasci]|uniref:SUN domain-containing protein n=1 Tax=Candida verbasci TaxID=1227364 RepID=A0A9W4TZD5_9ASCO|nr:unnamed protein product [Candida verbasci]